MTEATSTPASPAPSNPSDPAGLVPVDDWLAACLAAVSPLPPREVGLLEALGCRLAEDVVSAVAIPRFDNSSMDGYAVRAAESGSGAGSGAPVVLPVVGDVPAGHPGGGTLEPGTTVRIMTGAPVPAGADAVVPVEWTDAGTSSVRVDRSVEPGRNIRRVGEDVREGEVVLHAGARLSPRHVALLAAVGRDRVRVHPRPRVVVMPSGSELVAPGRALGPGQIHDSNGYGLVAAVRDLGFEAEHGGVMSDAPESVSTLMGDAVARADLVITTGGVSAGGSYDTVKAVLGELGTVRFAGVAMQPGKPQGFGTLGPRATPVFTLPGNPVSAMVSFEVFVRPVLRALAGAPPESRVVEGRAATGWRSPAGKRQFVRAVTETVDGVLSVSPVGGQGSHLVADLAGASALAVVEPDVSAVAEGDRVGVIPLEPGGRR